MPVAMEKESSTRGRPSWRPIEETEARAALRARGSKLDDLRARARDLRDKGRGRRITFSPKAFLPLTNLCLDRCAYCTFRRDEGDADAWTMRLAEVRTWSERARATGCIEALFCLGDRPEDAFPGHRRFLDEMGSPSTIHYTARACAVALECGLLPHSNPGLMDGDALDLLKPVNASLGMMLESTSTRLRGPGECHYYAPDKEPSRRLAVLEAAGERRIPFTTGLLIGIGETLDERIDALLALADCQRRHGHLQEVILQSFRAKPEIPMASTGEPDDDDLARLVAVARLLFGPEINLQVPPNLSAPESLPYLLESGINDLGGISPLTPDYVNPEAPWPHLKALARLCSRAGYELAPRLPIYDEFIDRPGFLAPEMCAAVGRARDELQPHVRLGAEEATA